VSGELNGNYILVLDVNGSNLGLFAPETEAKVQFTLYKDGSPSYTTEVTSAEAFRLPADCACEVYQIGLNTSIPIYNVTIADSVAELAQTSL
jgi:hypothetical protein